MKNKMEARKMERLKSWKLSALLLLTLVPVVYLPVAYASFQSREHFKLTIGSWTLDCHSRLRTRVEVSYETTPGRWVNYQSYWTPAVIYVAKCTRAYVFLREDPTCRCARFLFWDNYGIARGPDGNRNWYLDMTNDRTMVATYQE